MSARPPRSVANLALPRTLERSLSQGHPWVYREHVPPSFQAEAGAWVSVSCGAFRCIGLWDPSSAIALRLLAAEKVPDATWFERAVSEAWSLREGLRRSGTDAYRWLNGEGDGLPGIVADVYGPYAVIVSYSAASATLILDLARAMSRVTRLKGILHRASDGEEPSPVFGEAPPAQFSVRELGLKLSVALLAGQKTGLFLDHRNNRAWVGSQSAGKSVLNLFCYTGAFSLHALLGGAMRVTSVDIAKPVCEAARSNLSLNGFSAEEHPVVAQDAYAFLKGCTEEFDLVISDPPSFARSKQQRASALSAYVRLHSEALSRVKPGGLLCAASCTSQVDEPAFLRTLAEASARTRRGLRVVQLGTQAEDHPFRPGHPEGRYLKFAAVRVSDKR